MNFHSALYGVQLGGLSPAPSQMSAAGGQGREGRSDLGRNVSAIVDFGLDNQSCLSTKGKRILGIILLIMGVAALILGIAGLIAATTLLTGGAMPAVFAFVGLKLALGVGISGFLAGLGCTIGGGILCKQANDEDLIRESVEMFIT